VKFFDKRNLKQFLKFAVVGVSNTFIDWAVFFLLTHYLSFFQMTSHEVIAKSVSFTIAVTNSFIWNSLWTFRGEYQEGLKTGAEATVTTVYFGRFFLVSLIGLILNSLIFYLSRPLGSLIFSRIQFAQLTALIIATGTVMMWNFLANKFWTYKIKKETTQEIQKNRIIYLFVAVLIFLMFLISILVMRKDSAIVDEVAHIPAGYSYIEKFDMRLNPEHPPLAKAISAIPLTFLKLNKPFNDWSWDKINQWEIGWNFLYHLGNSADQILFYSRLPMLILTLLVGLIIFKWANQLYGNRVGLFVLFLFVFCPNFLAHGHWVTTDIAATLGFLVSIYFYDKQLKNPSVKNIIWAGIFFGIAQLLKFSAFLLFGILPIYLIGRVFIFRKEIDVWKYLKSQIWAMIQIFIIGLAISYFVYLFFGWQTTLDIEQKLIDLSLPTAGQAPFNHFLKILVAIPMLRPVGHYLLGLMMVFFHTEGGHTAFLLGKFSQLGFKLYFPLAFLFKVPLPIIILLLSSIIWLFVKKLRDLKDKWNVFVFLALPIIYFAFSIRSNLDIGIRHLLPIFPFLYLLIGRLVQPALIGKWAWQKIVLVILMLWYFFGTLLNFPHFMAYFNEIRYAFGLQKYQIFVDSSLDWGQDLRRLADYCKENGISDIKVDYFGGGVPQYYIPNAVEWHSKYGPVKEGWLAVSATFYQMSKYFGPRENLPDYSYLDNIKPTAIIGDSILVYHFK